MYSPHFRLVSFESIPHGMKLGVLEHLLEALLAANVAYLIEHPHPHTPRLYASGVRYLQEPDGVDEWQDIPDTIKRRTGDCEDLAGWRMAELTMGEDKGAKWHIDVDLLPDRSGQMVTTYHIQILRSFPDRWTRATAHGLIEDPSKLLGMP
ncbi:MAG: hypothetical protein ACHP7H_00785 [Hyphomicrobiales bacterium]